jgi:hypothetical protein
MEIGANMKRKVANGCRKIKKRTKKSARHGGKNCVYECHIGDEKGRRRKEKQDKKLKYRNRREIHGGREKE